MTSPPTGQLSLPCLHLLGTPRLLARGAAVDVGLQYRKGWALLGYLAVERGRHHAREQLAGLLWPGMDTTAARTNLRQVLNDLQRAFRRIGRPHLVHADKGMIGLRPPEGSDILFDIDLLDPLLTDEADVLALLDTTPAWQHRGTFLQGIDIAGDIEFEDWLHATRGHFLNREIRLMCRLRDHYLEAGKADAATEVARRLTHVDPWNEDHHRVLIQLLIDDGQLQQAQRIYTRLRHDLRRELHCEPSAETRALLERHTPSTVR